MSATGQEFTTPNGLLITGRPAFGTNGNDLVWDFINSGGQPTSGRWIVSTKVMVPTLDVNGTPNTGIGWFIMLNQYPVSTNWSVQINFDAFNGQVIPVEPTGTTANLIYDEWVDLVLAINLDSDRVDIYYGTQRIAYNQPWIGTGSAQIAAIDLYGGEPGALGPTDGITELFYDNIRMESAGTARMAYALTSQPGPVLDGGAVSLDITAPRLKNQNGMLFVSAVNGVPFSFKLSTFALDANGDFNLSVPALPTGLSGVQIDMWSFVLDVKGRFHRSNTHKMVIR
jgi:hypothetical protein